MADRGKRSLAFWWSLGSALIGGMSLAKLAALGWQFDWNGALEQAFAFYDSIIGFVFDPLIGWANAQLELLPWDFQLSDTFTYTFMVYTMALGALFRGVTTADDGDISIIGSFVAAVYLFFRALAAGLIFELLFSEEESIGRFAVQTYAVLFAAFVFYSFRGDKQDRIEFRNTVRELAYIALTAIGLAATNAYI